MEIERAIETQRLKLLRLLAGLFTAVALLSVGPIAPAWSRWVRSFVFSVLERAEAAAQSLVLAQACLIARSNGCDVDRARLAQRHIRAMTVSDADDVPSLADLRRRIVALRALLKDLPRRSRRLLRRVIAWAGGLCSDFTARLFYADCLGMPQRERMIVSRIERPPISVG